MIYESSHYKTFELLKVEKKMLAVSYEFTSRNNSRKWVIERDWKDIETAVEEYISLKKYLHMGHKESVDVAGDIQLAITTKACPSYLSKFFKVSSQVLNDHSLSIIVSHGRLQEQQKEAKAQVNGQTNDIPLTISSLDSDEEKYVPQSKTAKITGATYTPSKNIKTTGFEEYVPDGIPPETANQYKATKRKRRERFTSPDIIPESSESPVTPVRKSTRAKREICLLTATQVPFRKSPRSASPSRKSTPEAVLSRPEKASDLFGSDNTESDVELQETPAEEEAIEKTPEEGKKKKNVSIQEWLNKHPKESRCDTPRTLRIMSPTRTKKKEKKRHKEKKESTKTETKSPIIKKNCRHIPMKGLLSSFRLVEEEMDEAISQFMETRVIPKIKEYHFTRYVDLITVEQTDAALKFLSKRYKTQCNVDYGKLMSMFSEYVIPEWIFHLFMQEHDMDRNETIKYFVESERKAGLSWK